MKGNAQTEILVWSDWNILGQATQVGILYVTRLRGKEIFSFEYEQDWLKSPYAQSLDPTLRLFQGRQYPSAGQGNFAIFLDSCPDRWGRLLMRRREALMARREKRSERKLFESDYLLGVHDSHRMGCLRFSTTPGGAFLDDNPDMAVPPWTSLKRLERASLGIESDNAIDDPSYSAWLNMLIAPGSSLGGTRPKAGVVDDKGALWIAKFPSRYDDYDIGAWEETVNVLARRAGLQTACTQARKISGRHHTFLSKRFDRSDDGGRLHFASAMTLLQYSDGANASRGVSYLELAELLVESGASPREDLEELWRRIVFYICVSNTDDHLRNHGFLLDPGGWLLAPAYDINPTPYGTGLSLNVSESDNSLDLGLALEVAPYFRVSDSRAREIVNEVINAVQGWRQVAGTTGIPGNEQDRMASAFEHAKYP